MITGLAAVYRYQTYNIMKGNRESYVQKTTLNLRAKKVLSFFFTSY